MGDWGPLEIVLVLVLAIALLTNIGTKNTIQNGSVSQNQNALLSEKDKRCGLTVQSPVSLEKVAGAVRVAGNVSGCKWSPTDGTALYAQVVNGAGVPITAFTTVPVTSSVNGIDSFDIIIPFTTNAKGNGYVILVPTVSTKEAVSARIPIKFIQ